MGFTEHSHLIRCTQGIQGFIRAQTLEERLPPGHCLALQAPCWIDKLFPLSSSFIPLMHFGNRDHSQGDYPEVCVYVRLHMPPRSTYSPSLITVEEGAISFK